MKRLEPVVKKNSSYSVIFLRDDSGVICFKLKPGWIKLLAFLLIVFCAASGAAGYAAYYYWKRYQVVQLERTELVRKLGENRRQLGRFVGVEKIKESTLPRSTIADVFSITGGQEGGESQGNGKEANTGQSIMAVPSGAGLTGNEATAAPGDPASSPPPPETAGAISALSQILNSVGSVPPPGEPVVGIAPEPPPGKTAQTSPHTEEEHPALITEVQVRSLGSNTFRLVFDLSNKDQQITLNGRVSLTVGTKNGARHEIIQVNRDAMRFIINRYKRVNTSFTLPDGVRASDVAQIFLTVTAEDQSPVTYAFPFPSAF